LVYSLSFTLADMGLKIISIDKNNFIKMIEGSQCTVGWYVDGDKVLIPSLARFFQLAMGFVRITVGVVLFYCRLKFNNYISNT